VKVWLRAMENGGGGEISGLCEKSVTRLIRIMMVVMRSTEMENQNLESYNRRDRPYSSNCLVNPGRVADQPTLSKPHCFGGWMNGNRSPRGREVVAEFVVSVELLRTKVIHAL
jgi:hypothetical protein